MNNHEQATLQRDYQAVFKGNSTPQQGLRVLFDIMNVCGFFITNTRSPHEALVLESKKTVANHILAQVEMAPQYGKGLNMAHMSELISGLETAKQYQEVIKYESEKYQDKDNNK